MSATGPKDHPYVSRGGLKLAAALNAFDLDVTDLACADLGCNVGGFTDCLLQRGAAGVIAIDTGYGALAWKLRTDPRVLVMERTNALYPDQFKMESKSSREPAASALSADLVVIDLGWTRQERAIPAALRWRPRHIITLIKPHYEAEKRERPRRGILDDAEADQIARQALDRMPALGVRVAGHIQSPLRGGAGKGKRGNVEYLAWLEPV